MIRTTLANKGRRNGNDIEFNCYHAGSVYCNSSLPEISYPNNILKPITANASS